MIKQEPKVCDGGDNCLLQGGHKGDVKSVNVTDKESELDWGKFNYCERAIEEDVKRGFLVE